MKAKSVAAILAFIKTPKRGEKAIFHEELFEHVANFSPLFVKVIIIVSLFLFCFFPSLSTFFSEINLLMPCGKRLHKRIIIYSLNVCCLQRKSSFSGTKKKSSSKTRIKQIYSPFSYTFKLPHTLLHICEKIFSKKAYMENANVL